MVAAGKEMHALLLVHTPHLQPDEGGVTGQRPTLHRLRPPSTVCWIHTDMEKADKIPTSCITGTYSTQHPLMSRLRSPADGNGGCSGERGGLHSNFLGAGSGLQWAFAPSSGLPFISLPFCCDGRSRTAALGVAEIAGMLDEASAACCIGTTGTAAGRHTRRGLYSHSGSSSIGFEH